MDRASPEQSETISQFLTIDDVANALQLSTRQIHRLIRKGELDAHKFGRLWRISPNNLEAYVERCRFHPDGPKAAEKLKPSIFLIFVLPSIIYEFWSFP